MVYLQQGEFNAFKEDQEKAVKAITEQLAKVGKAVEILEAANHRKDEEIKSLNPRLELLESEKQNLKLELDKAVKLAAKEAVESVQLSIEKQIYN